MGYKEVTEAVEEAWFAFYDSLEVSGFTKEQVSKFEKQLDMKDVYNDVDDCAMEAIR
jgi:hypothetical protein